MCRPPLDSTPLGTNKTNRTTSPIDLIPVGGGELDPMPLTQPKEFPEQNGKAHVPGEPDPDRSSPDSSSNKSNLSKNRNYSKSTKKKSDKKKKHRKNKKQDASESSLIDSDLSNNNDYRRK